MARHNDYLQEIQRFTTSHYWNSGVRITTGIIVPMLILIHEGWLTEGIPFLFGALFVSLTDTPGPIHHRRNGMLVATGLNTLTVLITALLNRSPVLVVAGVTVLGFLYSMLSIYGARAGAIGTLALVIMVIHLSPLRHEHAGTAALLTAGGGLWYTLLSLLINRLQPYRLVEQALGENLMLIAGYIRARASFYKSGADPEAVFSRVMKEQVGVLKSQGQIRELLFKTRQFVGDASPKSRSMMMIFLESLDLFEETMYTYGDYAALHRHISADLLNRFYSVILQVVAEFEHVGLSVQAGMAVKRMPDLNVALDELEQALRQYESHATPDPVSAAALRRTLYNIRGIVSRISKIVLYTRLEAYDPHRFPDQELEKPAASTPLTFSLVAENLTIRSNNFRYATRITIALLAGYAVGTLFFISHAYWVMLTALTILKPVYKLTRTRNVQRVLGTLLGIVAASAILFLVSNNTVMLGIMVLCMLMAYSLLRVNYLGFVIFLTVYVVITFHFLNPVEFKSLIGERLVDTLLGSIIAALAARFIFPVWQQHQIQTFMKKSLLANVTYLLAAWNARGGIATHRKQYNAARNEAIVALTNLSDNFQQMLAEPGISRSDARVHAFVIASNMLTSRISALTAKDLTANADEAQKWISNITDTLQEAASALDSTFESNGRVRDPAPATLPPLHALAIIYSLARDMTTMTQTTPVANEPTA